MENQENKNYCENEKYSIGKKLMQLMQWLEKISKRTVFIMILSVISFVATIFFGIIGLKGCEDDRPFTAQIQIVDWKGSTQKENIDFIKESKIKIALCYGDKITDYKTVADNKIEFSNIPAEYKNNKVKVVYETSTEFPLLAPMDSIILKPKQIIDLKFFIKENRLGKISGTIKDVEKHLIKNVKIEVNDIVVFSDSLGFYCITIPLEKQELTQEITISKENFEPLKYTLEMITNNGFDFTLSK